jgi:hypothetical protein
MEEIRVDPPTSFNIAIKTGGLRILIPMNKNLKMATSQLRISL